MAGRQGWWRLVAVAGLGATLALTGCGAASESGSSAPMAPAQQDKRVDGLTGVEPLPTAAGEQGGAQGAPGGTGPGGQAPAQAKIDPRSIIYTGDITVRVDNVTDVAARAASIVEIAGGFVGSDKRIINERRSEVHLQLRVPAEKFASTVDALAKLGKEEARSTSTEDVTEAVVDVDARIETQKASVARTRALLGQARNLGEIVSIEAELAKREADLASLEARKRRLADLTSLSTVTAHLLGPDATAPITPEEKTPSFLDGLESGWNAFLGAMNVLLVVIGYLLPFAVVVGLPIVLLIWILRRRRPATPPPPAV